MIHLLFAATILLVGGASSAETTLMNRFILPANGGIYGGFSALHIGETGTTFLAVSDRGGFVSGTITRDTDGQIKTIAVGPPVAVKGYIPMEPPDSEDAEGLAVAKDGTIYLSFEQDHRIGQFASPSAPETILPQNDAFDTFSNNSGLEALAIDEAGALYAIPERSGKLSAPFPVYRLQNGRWDIPFAIPRTAGYLAVGADFGPDGRLYVLERKFSGISFYTRVRRVDIAAQTAETILETGFGVHGNMEGISVWRNANGETIMTLIADNNFQRILSNEIAEYRVDG
jgi:hypothetical protein